MSYLIDANALITPYQTYYAFDLVPQFWDFLAEQVANGNIIIIDKIYDEIAANKDKKKTSDALQLWIETLSKYKKSVRTKEILVSYSYVVNHINDSGKYTDSAVRLWFDEKHADPWLVATAKAENHKIITFETSKGATSKGQSWSVVKIPNVCEDLDVECVGLFNVLHKLGLERKNRIPA